MRSRTLKPGFFKNYDLAQIVRPWGRILFEGLWCMADREGKLKDRPEEIRAEIFPFDPEHLPVPIEEIINKLSEGNEPFIRRYEVDGNKYIQILNFSTHQNPHPRESKSTIPGPADAKKKKVKALSRNVQGQSKDMPGNVHDNVEVNIEREDPEGLKNGKEKRIGNNSSEIFLSKLLFQKIQERDPKAKDPNWDIWFSDMKLLIQRDHRDPPEVEAVILWCQSDSFWQNNILSPSKLRKQFTQLKLKMEKENEPKYGIIEG